MTITDKELKRLVTCENGGFYIDVVELARELLAARKVVRAAKAFLSVPSHKSFDMAEEKLNAALDAYGKARKD